MHIAITRLREKSLDDAKVAATFGHTVKIISPLMAELHSNIVQQFVLSANDNMFDAIFFTSAYPAEKIAPLLNPDITKTCRVIAIGPKTASVLHEAGIKAETLSSFYSRDLVPYLGEWVSGKSIGIPRADVPNPKLINAIEDAGGVAYEYRIYSLEPTNEIPDLDGVDAVLFTSAMSYKSLNCKSLEGILPIAIGEITADAMREGGVEPVVIGDGSLKGTLTALNEYLKNA